MNATQPSRRNALLAIAAAGLGAPFSAQAQAYPSKPIRVVVPYSAGGGADNSARLFSQAMSQILGQNFVVENRPGASGIVAATLVTQAPADGYTVLFDAFASAVNAVSRKLPYSFTKDLVPVSQAVDAPSVMVVSSASPFTSVKGFVEHAKANPGKISYASYGAGGAAHLAGELLKNQTGIDMVHVPYKGGAPAMTDLIGGQVNTYFANSSSALGHIKSGRLRPLAVTSAERVPALPDVPTFSELGYKDFVIIEWNGFFMPGGTPAAVVEKFSQACQQAAQSADVRQRLAAVGLTPVGNSPEAFQKFLAGQMKKWADLIGANKIVLGD